MDHKSLSPADLISIVLHRLVALRL